MKKIWILLAVVMILIAWIVPSPIWESRDNAPENRANSPEVNETAPNVQTTTRPVSTRRPETVQNTGNGVISYDEFLEKYGGKSYRNSGSTAPAQPAQTPAPTPERYNYVLNTNTHKFHYPTCSSVDQMKDSNKKFYYGTREEVIDMGYKPCGRCHP